MKKIETQEGIDYFNNVARRFVDKYIECSNIRIRDKLINCMSTMLRKNKGVEVRNNNGKIIYKS
ncbi:hypothetical protein DY120_07335 [Apilactobacillus micheneri]|uniref:Uncharacterized protein n=1 Tax=Apilactobacillus micheneri TaxID=1899430 RepID=A0ABY2YVL5_9LACO|nr:hypothetical protein [Apilactobacillus micheneri]TPR23111.1 hypothetical protein DY114_07320 [Apilactobacillus micheneri]TPR24429.1 hypothetical protein DY111_07335 [Apilactobacillus micheneri]TPR29376.1 hypothetical protein DY120_07335 [Apilactobacillus micheneri]TPR34583.1 hypothetical protein DY027_07325 [Apilactobacillus micheneri]